MSLRNRHRSFRALDDVETLVAVDGVDQLPLVYKNVVGRRTFQPRRRLGNIPAGFLWCGRIADVDHAQPAGEPGAEQRVAGDPFLELMRAKTRSRPAEWRRGFLQVEHRHRLDVPD